MFAGRRSWANTPKKSCRCWVRSEEHTSELQSQSNLVCRLLLEKKKKKIRDSTDRDMSGIIHPRLRQAYRLGLGRMRLGLLAMAGQVVATCTHDRPSRPTHV